jgi:hypothetical protein
MAEFEVVENEPTTVAEPLDLTVFKDDALVSAFIAVRDKREAASKKFKARDVQYSENLDKLRNEILRRQDERGIDSIKITGVGTAFKSTSMVASCGDWDMFYGWCVEDIVKRIQEGRDPKEVFGFFQKRLTLEQVKSYMKDHEGAVPPAVNTVTEYSVSIRRSTT